MKPRPAKLALVSSILLVTLGLALWLSGREDGDPLAVQREVATTSEARRSEAIAPLQVLEMESARAPMEDAPVVLAATDREAADAGAAGAVHGRAIDVRTGLGVEGGTVLFSAPNDEKIAVIPDEAGFFRLSPEVSSRVHSFYVKPPRGWRWRKVPNCYATVMPLAMRSGEREVRIELAETRAGFASGLAVSETGEPLPDFAFSLRKGSSGTEARTDADGRFVTQTELRGGKMHVWPEPGGGRARPNEVDVCVGVPLRLTFEVGPVIEIDLEGEPPSSDDPLGLWIFTESAFLSRNAQPARLHHRPDGSCWARPAKTGLAEGLPVVLAVADTSGSLYGFRREVHSSTGWDHPLRFELERTATLTTKVTRDLPEGFGEEGRPNMSQDDVWRQLRLGRAADVDVTRRNGGMLPRPFHPGRDGRWLKPGSYRVAASTRTHEEQSKTLELTSGERAQVVLHLPILERHRTVRGRVRTESGGPIYSLTVRLAVGSGRAQSIFEVSPRSGGCVDTTDHELRSRPDGTGAFAVELVPLGVPEVSVTEGSYACRIEMRDAPNGDLEVDVIQLDEPGGPGMGFRFEVENGRGPRAQVETRVLDSGRALHPFALSGRVLTRDLPAERRFEWAFLMWGKQPIYGTQADFRNTGENLWLADVAPQDGWGTRVVVTDPERTAVASAQVFVDGELAGWTDASGSLELTADKPPLTLRVFDPDRARESAPVLIDSKGPPLGWQTIVVQSVAR